MIFTCVHNRKLKFRARGRIAYVAGDCTLYLALETLIVYYTSKYYRNYIIFGMIFIRKIPQMWSSKSHKK